MTMVDGNAIVETNGSNNLKSQVKSFQIFWQRGSSPENSNSSLTQVSLQFVV